MKVLSLFSGIGAFEKALENIGIDCEIVGFSEIDRFAIKSYCAIHGIDESKNLGDITKINIEKLPRFIDMITHGSPCQDFSVAGKQAGGDIGAQTRSSLMWNTVEIVKWCLPKYVIWENVKNLLSKKHRHNFDSYVEIMNQLGYNSYYQVLNAKDYGIPQNRERVYTISIRKDIDVGYTFPKKEELKIRLKDILEDKVDEKYYLNDKQIKKIKESTYVTNQRRIQEKDWCDTLCARDWKDPKCVQVGELDIKGHEQVKRIYSTDGLCPTITTMGGGQREPKIAYSEESLKRIKQNIIKGDIANTLTANAMQSFNHNNCALITEGNIKVRKLTPKECWRLMGFADEDFEKAKEVPTSNTQLYKQAGNSIVVNVLEKIFKELLIK